MSNIFRRRDMVAVLSFAVGIMTGPIALAQTTKSKQPASPGPLIVLLGTGMPWPNPDRQGPSLAIVVDGKAYIVDAGVGVVRQAEAAYERGISALARNQLDVAFLTHLHSDHTLGLPDLILTPWVMHRSSPLQLYGPAGTQAMVDNIEKAYAEDIQIRVNGLEHGNTIGYKVVVHEIQPGVVYESSALKVTAFPVLHGSWKQAFGYRFDAEGKSIVISGDTRPAESVVQACDGCDVLIHEVYSGTGSEGLDAAYFASFHTSAVELGQLATRARPRLLVITHSVPLGSANQTTIIAEVQRHFHGPIIFGRDLDVIAP